MTGKQHKAFIINDFWAKTFSTLFAAAILGGFGFAWSVYADTTTLKQQVSEMKQASLPSRMDKLEERVGNGFQAQGATLNRLEQKLDKISDNLKDPNTDRRTR